MKLSVPMLVLAAGLTAAANTFAQTSTTSASTTRSNTVLSDGTHEVRVESDGVTASITLDGNQVAKLNMSDAWTVHKVTDASGAVIATIWRSGPGASAVSASFGDIEPRSGAGGGNAGQWMARLEGLMEDEKVREGLAQARGELETALARAGREMPNVMIGITMDETSDDLVKGLGYEAAKTSSITSVVDNGPAAKAGLQAGDVIVAFDDSTSADAMAIRDALKNNNPGDQVSVSYIRDGAVKTATLTLEAYSPQAFGLGVLGQLSEGRGNFRHFLLSDEEMSNLQKQIAELSEQLEKIASELATAIGARAEELGKLSAELGMQISDLASELARRSASALSSQFWRQAGEPDQFTVRVVPDGAGGSREIYVMPAPAAPTPPSPPTAGAAPAPADDAALRSMDDRIRRIEELLEKLAAQQAQPAPGGNR